MQNQYNKWIIRIFSILSLIINIIFIYIYIFGKNNSLWDFFNSNFFVSSITLIVGSFAIYIYHKQKQDEKGGETKRRIDKKKDIAQLILQEIRRAEIILDNYQKHDNYVFDKKIIATDSWAKNIYYFVDDFKDKNDLDRISNLYSTGKYLDSIIRQYSVKAHEKRGKESSLNCISVSLKQLEDAFHEKTIKNIYKKINFLEKVKINLEKAIYEINGVLAEYQALFKKLTFSHKSIHDSEIGTKLKKIAEK